MLQALCSNVSVKYLDAGNLRWNWWSRYNFHIFKNIKALVCLQKMKLELSIDLGDWYGDLLFLTGHCPHDELPEEVNQFVDEFVRRGPESGKQDRSTPPDMANATDDDPATAAEIIEEEIKLITEDLKS
jgi:hypothetical protein